MDFKYLTTFVRSYFLLLSKILSNLPLQKIVLRKTFVLKSLYDDQIPKVVAI